MTTSHIFQSTLPHGERQQIQQCSGRLYRFQSTLPHGERRRISKKMYKSGKFQSTLPHGERHYFGLPTGVTGIISIHAPAWGATETLKVAAACHRISIHAPAWEATSPAFTSAPASTYFNPRSRMGSDRLLTIVKIFIGISIHAPRMGSDRQRRRIRHTTIHFNPRPPHGERRKIHNLAVSDIVFQSTLPAWGATTLFQTGKHSIRISIHAPRMGSDLLMLVLLAFITISIHAPRMGSDFERSDRIFQFVEISIHAPRMGSDV